MIRAIILFLLFLFFTPDTASAAVVINELLPKTDPASYEWVELYNTGSEPVSLDRWKLDHVAGDAAFYLLNASARIEPHGFLTLSGSQTAINFSIGGDTVRLFDDKNNLVDSQSYPGILGYNTSMGRSTDGGDGWVICAPEPYEATPNKNNNCPPAPTATPTQIPTNTPTPTILPTPTSTPAPVQQTFGSFLPSPTATQILGVTVQQTPTPSPVPEAEIVQFAISKTRLAYFFLGIAAAAGFLMTGLWIRGRIIGKKG